MQNARFPACLPVAVSAKARQISQLEMSQIFADHALKICADLRY
jgi:hypothetical protein